MSKFTDAAATSHSLSLAAMEEASRCGQRTADIDHLLLALVVNEQSAGRTLRSLGITLDAAREAVAAQHAEQLASLGIHLGPPAPGRITFHETGGYEWGERAVEIIKAANSSGKRGDAAAVLRELVAEPSGLIAAILHRLGTAPDSVVAQLDELDETGHRPGSAFLHALDPGALAGVTESFAPAPIEQVWELLANPARMPEWEPSIGRVHDAPDGARVGDVWTAQARERRPDGKPIRVKAAYQKQRVELIAREEDQLIGWLFTYPDAPDANAKRIRVELEKAEGGTQLRISLAWVGSPGRRRPLLGWFMRPLSRLALRLQLSHLGSAISRVFR